MELSDKEKLEVQCILKIIETANTAQGAYLIKAIKNSTKIPEELKPTFITWAGSKELGSILQKISDEINRYNLKTLKLKKHWWG